jgi:hypothetical protein
MGSVRETAHSADICRQFVGSTLDTSDVVRDEGSRAIFAREINLRATLAPLPAR